MTDRCTPSAPCGACDFCQDDLLVGLHDGGWLDQQQFPPLRFAVPNIIPEGLSLLVGPPKVGKSWFVLSAALGVAHGGYVLGNVSVDRRPVLYLALEDGHRRLQDRCRTLLEGDPIPPAMEYLTTVQPGKVLLTIEAWLDRHVGSEPLIVLDTLGKVMPPAMMGESTYQRDYRVGGALKRLADGHPGCSLLVNHHDRKAAYDDFVDAVSGTHGLAGSADTIIVLSRPRHENDGLLKVTGRDVPEGEYALTFTGGARWQLDGATFTAASTRAATARVTVGLGDQAASIVEFIATHPTGVRPAEVALALALDPVTVRKYMRRLEESGRLARHTRGTYTPVTSVTSVTSDEVKATQETEVTPLWGDDSD